MTEPEAVRRRLGALGWRPRRRRTVPSPPPFASTLASVNDGLGPASCPHPDD